MSGLSLITAAIMHWNTVYLDHAVRQLRAQDATIPDDLLAHVAPLGWEHIGWEHIGLTGDYVWGTSDHDAPFTGINSTASDPAELVIVPLGADALAQLDRGVRLIYVRRSISRGALHADR